MLRTQRRRFDGACVGVSVPRSTYKHCANLSLLCITKYIVLALRALELLRLTLRWFVLALQLFVLAFHASELAFRITKFVFMLLLCARTVSALVHIWVFDAFLSLSVPK